MVINPYPQKIGGGELKDAMLSAERAGMSVLIEYGKFFDAQSAGRRIQEANGIKLFEISKSESSGAQPPLSEFLFGVYMSMPFDAGRIGSLVDLQRKYPAKIPGLVVEDPPPDSNNENNGAASFIDYIRLIYKTLAEKGFNGLVVVPDARRQVGYVRSHLATADNYKFSGKIYFSGINGPEVLDMIDENIIKCMQSGRSEHSFRLFCGARSRDISAADDRGQMLRDRLGSGLLQIIESSYANGEFKSFSEEVKGLKEYGIDQAILNNAAFVKPAFMLGLRK